MEVLNALAIIVTLWGPVKYFYRWGKTRPRRAQDYVLPPDLQLSSDQQHYRFMPHTLGVSEANPTEQGLSIHLSLPTKEIG